MGKLLKGTWRRISAWLSPSRRSSSWIHRAARIRRSLLDVSEQTQGRYSSSLPAAGSCMPPIGVTRLSPRRFPTWSMPALPTKGCRKNFEQAGIVDPALRELIGDKIHLRFEMTQWKTAAFGGPRVKTLIQGSYSSRPTDSLHPGTTKVRTLMVKFSAGKGSVDSRRFTTKSRTATWKRNCCSTWSSAW